MRIAFLGLGKMGSGMAARLAAAGHSLAVYNRTAARAESLAKLGARVADSARSAAENADVIIGMTADDQSSRAVWLGEQGALAANNAPDALAIECSTLSHEWVLDLARRVRARGFRYVDAPVTGLPDAAASGTLTLLVGADPADLDAARPVFASLATRVLHFGPVGISASRVTGIEWTIRGSALGVTFLGGSIFTVDGLFPDRLVINSERVHGATARTFNDDTMRDYTVVADPLVAKPTSTSPGEWTWFHQATLDEILADGGFVYLSGTRQGGATTYHWRITEFSLAFIVEARTPLRGRQRTSGTTGSIPLRGRNRQPYGLRGRQNADL